jgi:small membrane protein
VNGFQWIACTALGAALVRELVWRRSGAHAASLRTARIMVLGMGIVAIANPTRVTRVANLLGIGRGADIVLYVLALAFAAAAFYFYAQQLRLRRQLTALASHIALREATRGGRTE